MGAKESRWLSDIPDDHNLMLEWRTRKLVLNGSNNKMVLVRKVIHGKSLDNGLKMQITAIFKKELLYKMVKYCFRSVLLSDQKTEALRVQMEYL